MKQLLLIIAVVVSQSVLGADKKPLTKEESAKVIEAAIRKQLKKPTGELTEADFEKVTRLDLYNNQLTEVPKGLEKLTQLTFLELSVNKLTDVKGLEKLTKLKKLGLSSNENLTSVEGLENLTQLMLLGISDNQLTKLPKSLEKLTQLRELYLQVNKLNDVKGLEKLTQLKTLDLHGNQLTSVKGLEKLTQLQVLWLQNNPKLTKVQIGELKKALPKCKISTEF